MTTNFPVFAHDHLKIACDWVFGCVFQESWNIETKRDF